MSTWYQILSRRKHIPVSSYSLEEDVNTSNKSLKLNRVFNTLDLTFLGIGSTLGVGIYVLAGHVAKDIAGPSVIISFLIAAIASLFAGLCYAEFGARVPKAGSAYIYSYATIGELIAFIIGWNLILEYVIGSASVAKAFSIYLDSLLNDTMKNAFIHIAPMQSTFTSNYFDFFSFSISLLLGGALAFGLKESSLGNNICTSINILVVLFIIIAGSFKANFQNWALDNAAIQSEYGNGGFFPFGVTGTIKGAATCFYAFVGFDCIATTGEEVKNPKRAIPFSIILSLFITFLAYFGTSAILTLMVPYYLQDSDKPIPSAFTYVGWEWAKWIISIGGIFALCASLFGAMFPLPRIIYAMASDGLVFKFFAIINNKFRTPVIGTLLASFLTGIMSAVFNLSQLVNMMSIGTLLAYTIVAVCIIILRYSQEEYIYDTKTSDVTENRQLINSYESISLNKLYKQIFKCSTKEPNVITQKLVSIMILIYCIFCVFLGLILALLEENLCYGDVTVILPSVIIMSLMIIILISIYCQPQTNAKISFNVPLVPFIPALSIFVNIYLMMKLDVNTWIRFGIWMGFGLPIYFCSSVLYKKPIQKQKNIIHTKIQNGIVNDSFKNDDDDDNEIINKKKNIQLTIPVLNVNSEVNFQDPIKNNDVYSTEKIEIINNNSTDEENVLKEFDKILNESEIIDDINNFEAINETISLNSIDSDSDHSREYYVKVEIHQEDSDKLNTEHISSNNLKLSIPEPPPIEDFLKNNHQLSIKSTNTEEINNDENTLSIPKPPSIEHFLNNKSFKTPAFSPIKIDFESVTLKPVQQIIKKRTDKADSEIFNNDNLKPGSANTFKIKLDNIFKNRSQILKSSSEKNFFIENENNTITSNNVEEEIIQQIDIVLEQFENENISPEIPDDFGKTTQFKESLSKLISKKYSNNLKLDEKLETFNTINNNNNTVKIDNFNENLKETYNDNQTKELDVEKHKKLMITTLRLIKSRRTSLSSLADSDN